MRRNVAWMVAGNFVFAATQWAMLAGLAKLSSAEAVGKFNVGLAVTAPVALLFSLGLRSLQATDAREQFPFATYLTLRLAGVAAAVGLSIALAFLSHQMPDTRLVIAVIALSKAFAGLSEVAYGLLQKHERMSTVGRSLIGRGILSLLALLIAVAVTDDVVGGSSAMSLAGLLVLLVYDLPKVGALEPIRITVQLRQLRKLLITALPLGLVAMLISLNANLPIYFIQAGLGEAAVGYFAAINYIGYSGNTFVGALAQVAGPRLARLHVARDESAFRSELHRMMGIGLAMGTAGLALALLAGEPLLRTLYGADYARHTDVFAVLMLGYGFGYSAAFLGVSLTARRLLRTMVAINVLAVALNAAACWLLVPGLGILGAAWAWVLSSAFKLAANYRVALAR